MELKSYRKKGINAYLILDGAPMEKAIYGSPASEEDRAKAHKSKLHTVIIDESGLPDGTYRYKEAGGADFNKSTYGWVNIEAGEIIDEGDGSPPPASSEFMPQLEGTDRQVSWGAGIRAKAAAKHGAQISHQVATQTAAKWWIDNRDQF